MDQGYQMFSQFYIQPIKRVAATIARTAVRETYYLTKGILREGVRGAKLVGKTAGSEIYKRVVTSRYELRQLEKKKRLALDIEAEYAQKRCETYVDKFDKYIFPNFKAEGISTKICDAIRDQWLDLSAPDVNPHETLMDYATLQKGYETLSKAALSGDRLKMEEAIKDWNSLYKARMEMRGHEEEAFNKGQEDFEKDMDDSGKKETQNKEKDTEKTDLGEDKQEQRDATHDRSNNERTRNPKTDRVRKSYREDRITPDEAKEIGSQAVKHHDEVLYKGTRAHVHGDVMMKNPGKTIEDVAHKAEQQLRKEEERAAKMSAKEISKMAERISHGNER